MKIGKQLKSALVYPKDIDRFVADTWLSPVQTRARIPMLASRLFQELPGIERPHPVSESVASMITERCRDYEFRFRRK